MHHKYAKNQVLISLLDLHMLQGIKFIKFFLKFCFTEFEKHNWEQCCHLQAEIAANTMP